MNKGQIWIDTVIYTLIALIMIGAVLTFVKPKIEEIQDKAVIDQTIGIMDGFDQQINSVSEGGTGNIRIMDVQVKKGNLNIYCSPNNPDDLEANKIVYSLEGTRSEYGEPCVGTVETPCSSIDAVPYGNIDVLTEKKGNLNDVSLTLDYQTESRLNKYISLECNGAPSNTKLTLSQSQTPYKIQITNLGVPGAAKTWIDIKLVS